MILERLKTPNRLFQNSKGFSLVEILVAMALLVFLLMLAANSSFSSREQLDEAINDTERAIRFGMDEAALRNVIIRLHFLHDKDPVEYALEYGPSDNFVLPISLVEEDDDDDEEEREKKAKEFNKKFNRIQEFQDSNRKLPGNVRLIAVGTRLMGRLITEFHSSIYLFPTGEKDAAMIFFGTDEEMASLSLEGFTDEFTIKYHKLDPDTLDDEIIEKQQELAEELFEKWMK